MEKSLGFELNDAHRYFSEECFNRAWDFIDKSARSPEEDQSMLLLGMASLWHWTHRPDVTPANLSIGYWQVSRIFALLGLVEEARQYGQLCLVASQGEGCQPFHLGYAYEALARAETLAGENSKAGEYLRLARQASEKISGSEDRKQLLDGLATIK